MDLPPELAALPAPAIIDEIDFEIINSDLLAKLKSIFDLAGVEYDAENLESDPAVILVEIAGYIDTLLRQRINEAIRANLLPYATGADLDILAAFYGVTRLFGEVDGALRSRVVLAIKGRSLGGTEAAYKSIARNADVRVADVAIYRVGNDPTIYVAVFSTDNNGVADQALLEKVRIALSDKAKRIISDRFVVAAAARQTVNIEANVWLLPDTPDSIITDMAEAMSIAWAKDMAMGRDVTHSWLSRVLHMDGVHEIEIIAPASKVTIPPHEAAALGAVVLNNMGRKF